MESKGNFLEGLDLNWNHQLQLSFCSCSYPQAGLKGRPLKRVLVFCVLSLQEELTNNPVLVHIWGIDAFQILALPNKSDNLPSKVIIHPQQ